MARRTIGKHPEASNASQDVTLWSSVKPTFGFYFRVELRAYLNFDFTCNSRVTSSQIVETILGADSIRTSGTTSTPDLGFGLSLKITLNTRKVDATDFGLSRLLNIIYPNTYVL